MPAQLPSRLHPCRRRRRIAMRYRRAHWIGATEQNAIAEKAQRLVVGSGGARIEHSAVTTVMQLLSGSLKRRPGSPARPRSWQVELGKPVWSREIRDVAYSDAPSPEVARHAVGRRQRDLCETPIPLRPGRSLFVGQVDRCGILTALPATAGWRRGQPQRIRPMRSLPPPRAGDRHTLRRSHDVLRERGLFEC